MNKKPLRRKLRDDFFYLLVVLFIKILRLMPRRPALMAIRLLARLAFPFARAPRQRATTNLSRVYGNGSSGYMAVEFDDVYVGDVTRAVPGVLLLLLGD